jgi:prophage regulatory protein
VRYTYAKVDGPLAFDLVEREDIRLMGIGEIADRLKVTPARANQIADSIGSEFPRPLARLKMGKVWLKDDVEAWISAKRPHLNEGDQP